MIASLFIFAGCYLMAQGLAVADRDLFCLGLVIVIAVIATLTQEAFEADE